METKDTVHESWSFVAASINTSPFAASPPAMPVCKHHVNVPTLYTWIGKSWLIDQRHDSSVELPLMLINCLRL